ncbi:MAG: hypothetical protein FJX77_03100 [Armatimonadetes bacterium]|nr:transglycosylase SLT domain-containing protein [Candidatus Handelsmanbacteria bacterium]MBM3457510.1 hypothetical protein [Armatimonadota bacterium]
MALTAPRLTAYAAGLRQWHQPFPGAVRWRITAQGLEVEGSGVPRTLGQPITITRICQQWGRHLEQAAAQGLVSVELLVATVATESGGDPEAVRLEPGYRTDERTPDRMSAGLCQLLLSTAREVLDAPRLCRRDLLDPQANLLAAARQISRQSDARHLRAGLREQHATDYDPPRVAAAYNAGGLYREQAPANPWRLKCYPLGTGRHVTSWVRWYNDAWAVLGGGA